MRTGALVAIALACLMLLLGTPGRAAEETTGGIVVTVLGAKGRPIAGARVGSAAPSALRSGTTDASGVARLLALPPDTYTLSAQASGFRSSVQQGVVVQPGATVRIDLQLTPVVATIGSVHAANDAFAVGSPSDSFTVPAPTVPAAPNPAGLGLYNAGTAQGAAARVPGIDLDAFGNAIARGGTADDTVFEFDGIPVVQGLIAEPGGNIAGPQLFSNGAGETLTTLAGFSDQADDALGGVVDQIASGGTYPPSGEVTLSTGIGALDDGLSFIDRSATPDLRWRYAFLGTFSSQALRYGDGSTFYPAEAGAFGLALQSRGVSALTTSIDFAATPKDDLSFLGVYANASYDQYGTPYAGETYGAFNGAVTTFPAEPGPNVPVTFASGVQGNYGIVGLRWQHQGSDSTTRVQLYRSQFGSTSGGPFWDDLAFPDGIISLASTQQGVLTGLSFDDDAVGSAHHQLRWGADYRVDASVLDQVVPTADEYVAAAPVLSTARAYLGDVWSPSSRFDLAATMRLTDTHIVPGYGTPYDESALDPHAAFVYHLDGGFALRATYDRTSVAPAPLEVGRTDSTALAPPVQLAPEIGRNLTFSFEGGRKTRFRATYFAKDELNHIDVLPYNFRSAIAAGANPSGVGVPTNAGRLLAHGAELWMGSGRLTFDANYLRGYSSSASQFAFNSLNGAAVAAGQLFPLGYVPDLTTTLSYEFDLDRQHVRITPGLSWQSGYPYGNGTDVWIFNPVTHQPEQVPNDNNVNPGYNYYFLANPALPYNAVTNPYIGTLGTPEGPNPNTLRSPPQLLVSLHVEADVTPRLTAVLDVANLLGTATPTALQSNPYLIGPPGYAGGNPLYGAAYANDAGFSQPYDLGNGVPTNDGVNPAVPWTYGTAGYVPQSYPLARSIRFSLRYRL